MVAVESQPDQRAQRLERSQRGAAVLIGAQCIKFTNLSLYALCTLLQNLSRQVHGTEALAHVLLVHRCGSWAMVELCLGAVLCATH